MLYKEPYWIPIVVKNKDFLVGYIQGINLIKRIVEETAKKLDLNFSFMGHDLCLDSSRFNDITEDGRLERNLSENEMKEYYQSMIERKFSRFTVAHPENNQNLYKENVLTIECSCGLGFYTYKNYRDIPDKTTECQLCGKKIIDYTSCDDENFEFDGKRYEKN